MKSYNGFTPEQRMAGDRQLKAAVARGEIKAPTECEMCGLTKSSGAYIWFHCEDYANAVKDRHPLCVECHMTLHSRFRLPNVWLNYCDKLRTGWKPTAWRSNGAYFAMNAYQTRDSSRLGGKFLPITSKWWENLPMRDVVAKPVQNPQATLW